MPGTAISISNGENGTKQRAAAANAGIYRFANLQPKMYTVSRTREGFPTAVANPFTGVF